MTTPVAPGTPAAAPAAPAAPPPAPAAAEGGSLEAALAAYHADAPVADGAAPPPAAAPEPPPAPEPQDKTLDEVSRSHAALTARKQRLKADQAQHEANVKAFENEKAAVKRAQEEDAQRREHAKKNPLEALKQMGWTYEEINAYVLKNGEIPHEKIFEGLKAEFQAQIDKIREERNAELEEAKKEREAHLLASRKHAAEAFEADTAKEMEEHFKADLSKYRYLDCIDRRMALHKVLEYQVKYFEQSGRTKTLAITDAMLYAEKEAKATADWFAKLHQSDPRREGAVQPANPGEQSVTPVPQSLTAVRGITSKVLPEDMSDEERLELAKRQMTGAA